MAHANIPVEEAVVEILKRSESCCLDDLVTQLPDHTWSAVFAAVDAMSRDGRLSLRRGARSSYQISLLSPKSVHADVHP